MPKNELKQNNLLLFWIPTLVIIISFVALIYGIISNDTIKTYADLPVIALVLFWFPLSLILLNFIIIFYGIVSLDANTYAKTSFILSLFFWLPALNLFTSILAVIYGFISVNLIRKDKKQKGMLIAIASITIGITTLIASFTGMLLFSLYPEFFNAV